MNKNQKTRRSRGFAWMIGSGLLLSAAALLTTSCADTFDSKETFDAGVIKGHKAYLFLDVSIIGTIGDMMGNSTAKMGAEAAKQYIKSLECYDTGETQFELVLNMADAEKDPIEFFINLALQQF